MKDKKCKDCLELSGEKVPVCNYHQGYYKALKEVEKMIDTTPHKNKGFMQNVDDIETFKQNLKQQIQKMEEK